MFSKRKNQEIKKIIECVKQDTPLPQIDDGFRELRESITLMRNRYKQHIQSLENNLSEQKSSAKEVQRIRGEHHIAEQIQRSMLPSNTEHLSPQIELYADMDTAWEIGGDYYDYFMIDDHHLFFCIADVSGKSVSAALFSMVVKTAIGMSVQNGETLAEVCNRVSKQLYLNQHGAQHFFVTAWMGILDVRTGKLSYVNAGHEAPVLLKNNGEAVLCTSISGIPIAAYYNPNRPEKSIYQMLEMQLSPGDALMLYTDGVSESANREGERLGQEQIIELTKRYSSHTKSVKDWVTYIQRNVVTHANHVDRDDDITILALRWISQEERFKA